MSEEVMTRCLEDPHGKEGDRKGNFYSRSLHVILKPIIRQALSIMQKMTPMLQDNELTFENSRKLQELKKWILERENNDRTREFIAPAIDFMTFLNEGDRYYRDHIRKVLAHMQEIEWESGEPPIENYPEYWKEK